MKTRLLLLGLIVIAQAADGKIAIFTCIPTLSSREVMYVMDNV